jgi:hypothetical protein
MAAGGPGSGHIVRLARRRTLLGYALVRASSGRHHLAHAAPGVTRAAVLCRAVGRNALASPGGGVGAAGRVVPDARGGCIGRLLPGQLDGDNDAGDCCHAGNRPGARRPGCRPPVRPASVGWGDHSACRACPADCFQGLDDRRQPGWRWLPRGVLRRPAATRCPRRHRRSPAGRRGCYRGCPHAGTRACAPGRGLLEGVPPAGQAGHAVAAVPGRVQDVTGDPARQATPRW